MVDKVISISVVLCTWNNSRRLSVTLGSLVNLKIPSSLVWELIIVNNNSTDSTFDVASSFTDKLPIKYVAEPKQGLSHARNAGLLAASGELIIFTDDDIKPCRDWLSIYWHAYQLNPEGSFWGGPIESDFEEQPENMELIQLAPCSVRGLDWGRCQRLLAPGEYFISANWACSAKNLKSVGWFDTSLGLNPASGKVLVGEESDLMNRLVAKKIKPMYLPEAYIKHFVPKEKLTLAHIASRVEALGRIRADEIDVSSVPLIKGVPRWMWFKAMVLWKRYFVNRIMGKNYYVQYMAFRRSTGAILGLLEKNK